jgi:GntR family transcriptional regulator, gluconate operon transcriptional repressor
MPTVMIPKQSIRRRLLSSEVTHALRAAILNGVYRPGDHLTEAEIAREMRVSHGPVREALRELEAEELIVIEPHRGAFVKAFTADDVREIYSLRCVLETAMVNLLVDRVTPADLAELDALIEAMRRAVANDDPYSVIELDLEFHRRMAEMAGHRRLYDAWRRLASPIRLFLTMAIPRYLSLAGAADSHLPIMDALRHRDAAAAARYMEHGVLAVGERIAAAMGAATVSVPTSNAAG